MTFEEIKEHEFKQRCSFSTDWDAYSIGWDAAMDATAPIIEAAISTWNLIARGTGDAAVAGLGKDGFAALALARAWRESHAS